MKSNENVHRERYLISVLCEVAKLDTGEVHRGVVFKVLRNTNYSAVIQLIGQKKDGENWEIVRESELYMNGPFDALENRIRELFNSEPVHTEASFEIKYDTFTNQVRRNYMLEKGFTSANIPWAGLANHYKYGAPVTKQDWKDKFGIEVKDHTGFAANGYRDGGHTKLDITGSQFSQEDLRQAEIQADILAGKLGVK